jgi:hypothetical protein
MANKELNLVVFSRFEVKKTFKLKKTEKKSFLRQRYFFIFSHFIEGKLCSLNQSLA